jgi:hypothetical protein
MIKFTSIVFLALVFLSCSPFSSTFYAEGYVADKITKTGIPEADVILTILNHESSNKTDINGKFKIGLNIFPDSSTAAILIIDKTGYKRTTCELSGWHSSPPDTFYLVRI